MQTIELHVAPVLTPKTIDRISVDILDADRRFMRETVKEAIDVCFVPFMKIDNNQYRSNIDQYYSKFDKYRLRLIMKIVEFIGPRSQEAFSEIIDSMTNDLANYNWAGIGIQRETLIACVNRYKKSSKLILSSFRSIDATYDSHPSLIFAQDLCSCATKIDFCMTAVFLGAEKEVDLPRSAAVFLVGELISSLDKYDSLAKVASKDEKAEFDYFRRVSRSRNFISMIPSENDKNLYSDNIKPVNATPGEKISDIILRERR